MEELSEEICLLFEGEPIHLSRLKGRLEDLIQVVSSATSRLVDIDSSGRDDQKLYQQVRLQLAMVVKNKEQEDLLFQIYESLKTYLGLKYKYGEAADWFLKNEFDSHLETVIRKSI